MITISIETVERIQHRWSSVSGFFTSPKGRVVTFIALVIGGGLIAWRVGMPTPSATRPLLEAAGIWAPIVGISGIAVLVMAMFPRGGLAILAGMLSSPLIAICCVLAGAVLGAAGSFAFGRTMGQPYLRAWVQRYPKGRLARFELWVENHGIAAMIYTRIIPLLPYGVVNYSMGATNVRFGVFLLGTVIGILPSTVFYVLVGATFTAPTSPAFLISAGVGILVAAVGMLCVRNARRQLSQITGLATAAGRSTPSAPLEPAPRQQSVTTFEARERDVMVHVNDK